MIQLCLLRLRSLGPFYPSELSLLPGVSPAPARNRPVNHCFVQRRECALCRGFRLSSACHCGWDQCPGDKSDLPGQASSTSTCSRHMRACTHMSAVSLPPDPCCFILESHRTWARIGPRERRWRGARTFSRHQGQDIPVHSMR